MNKDKALKDILKQRLEILGLSILQFSKQTGIPVSRIYKWYKQDTNPKQADTAKIQEWLNSKNGLEKVPREMTREEMGPSYLEMRRYGKQHSEEPSAPLVSVKARAGYSQSYEDADFVESLDEYQLPPGIPSKGAEWMWFEVGGDSMQPVILDGDILLCSLIAQADWHDLEQFKAYVIVYKREVAVKRLALKNQEDWVLISEDEENNPQRLIHYNDIKEIWKVRRRITAQLPPTKRFKITV